MRQGVAGTSSLLFRLRMMQLLREPFSLLIAALALVLVLFSTCLGPLPALDKGLAWRDMVLACGAFAGWAFALSGLAIALTCGTLALGLYPRVMVSSLNDQWSLTIYNTSSSDYTLTVITIVAAIFVPIVLLYQAWSYWVFRKRVGREDTLEY